MLFRSGDHGCEYMTGGRVIVLGRTGRNFAAGMSGGVAYVYNPDGTFGARCNMELVGFDPMEEDDLELVKTLVTEHRDRTDSIVAARILDNWAEASKAFVKVMPHDYKRAMAEMSTSDGHIDYPDDHPVSSGGEGFVTSESETPAGTAA